jgi:hypothetical protein
VSPMKKVLFLAAALLAGIPAWGLEKGGMPDLAQVDQTCLPTSTANLLIWFGKHGYPKLILPGDTEDDREAHTVHMIMADTGARYDIGTEMDAVTKGIETYIHSAGYACDVEYRGLQGTGAAFTPDWLRENDKPDKGFILLLTYCQYHRESNSFVDAWNAGHAVTLVNAEPDMLLIHDPAHESDETGRKIVTPLPLKDGVFLDQNTQLPVAGLMMLSGSLLEAPPDSGVMLTGAVCVTMRPGGPDSPTPVAAPNSLLAGTGSGTGPASTPAAATAPAHRSWWSWCMSLILGN